MENKVSVTLDDTYQTTIRARDHVWDADVPQAEGGTDSAPNPEEMLLGALGSCIAMTTKMYANRKQWPLERVEVTLELERFKGSDYAAYNGEAQFVHEIRESITFYGPLSDDQRVRLLEIAGKCPVRRIITSPVFIVEKMLQPETETLS
jgi:putative redox protein